jgi:hypothetical protein
MRRPIHERLCRLEAMQQPQAWQTQWPHCLSDDELEAAVDDLITDLCARGVVPLPAPGKDRAAWRAAVIKRLEDEAMRMR